MEILDQNGNQEGNVMYSAEQRRKAIETYIKFDHSIADTIRELGYPGRHTLYRWWEEFQLYGEKTKERKPRSSKYSYKQKKAAVDYYLEHGKNISRTIRVMGYPCYAKLCSWIDEIAPNQRKIRTMKSRSSPIPIEKKMEAVVELEARSGTAEEVSTKYGVSRITTYLWRRNILEYNNDSESKTKGEPVSKTYDDLPDDIESLKNMKFNLKEQVRMLQLEIDVRQATLEILKKDLGTDPNRLKNTEKAAIIMSLRPKWKLKELLAVMNMSKSSYEYAAKAITRPETKQHLEKRNRIKQAFSDSGDTYGYRRIAAQTSIGEWTVRVIMKEENLVARTAKKKRRYNSYQGEITEAPDNLLRDKQGKHHFRAEKPNDLWITDITEFHIPAGKLYLSPIIDCFDGMPISWSMSTSPNAEMANNSLLGACAQLKEGEHPKSHSDRGCHYRWPGWIKICEDYGIVRSMSRKGCSPDNARAEGFFGRLKIEFFYGRDWKGVTIDEFADMLDAYLRWYRDIRLKSDLGYKSPMQYRKELGLIA